MPAWEMLRPAFVVTGAVVAVMAAALVWALVRVIRTADQEVSAAVAAALIDIRSADQEGGVPYTDNRTRPSSSPAPQPVWELPPDADTGRVAAHPDW